jgi:hypothetical protein
VRKRRCRLPNRLLNRLSEPRRGAIHQLGRRFGQIKRATVRNVSTRRPLARNSVTKRAILDCVGGLGDLATGSAATPPKGPSMPSALRNYASPQHFCHFRGYDSAWVPRTVLGRPVWEIEPSLPIRPWPYRASMTPFYYVTAITSRVNNGAVPPRAAERPASSLAPLMAPLLPGPLNGPHRRWLR